MIHFKEPRHFGRLIKRYQRFFMDVELDNGELVTAHTPNTGSMLGLLTPGNRVMLTFSNDPKRRTRFTAQAIEADQTWVGINTQLPNKLIAQSLDHPTLKALAAYPSKKAEYTYGIEQRSRADFYFYDAPSLPPHFVEIKNVTMRVGNYAQFPDAVSLRAQKHLHDLMDAVSKGLRASLIFVVQRQDCLAFTPASMIDARYAELLRQARCSGVSIQAITATIDESGLALAQEIPCVD